MYKRLIPIAIGFVSGVLGAVVGASAATYVDAGLRRGHYRQQLEVLAAFGQNGNS
jgi:hypothetical protein